MKRNLTTVAVVFLLVLLVCAIGAALFTVYASPVDEPGNLPTGIGGQACYTLDTSRPEWLQPPPIYLPLIMKDHTS